MAASAGEVGQRYDLVLNGEGYLFADTEQEKGVSSFAPTFLQRTNVGDAYADTDQDWWLTMSQADWALGGGQRYFRPDEDASRRFWSSTNVEIEKPGRVSLRRNVTTLSFSESVYVAGVWPGTGLLVAGTSKLWYVDATGAITDKSAHGLGTTPTCMTADDTKVYVSAEGGGSAGIRKWTGSAYSTFSATGASLLAFLNNTLYGISSNVLKRWSTAGTASTVYTWLDSDGSTAAGPIDMCAYGGDLALIRGGSLFAGRSTLEVYDGVAPAVVAQFPDTFVPLKMVVHEGALFIVGVEKRSYGPVMSAAVMVYLGGSLSKLWVADSTSSTIHIPTITSCDAGVVWTDELTGTIYRYHADTGAVVQLGTYTKTAGTATTLGSTGNAFIRTVQSTTTVYYPASTYATSGSVTTSLFDGETTRKKRFKSVLIDYDAGSGGDGGSVDIAYRIGDPDSTFTTVQSSAASGTEYSIGQSGTSISIKVTINAGTSTTPPVLKRIYVRAAPLLDGYRKERYVLNLTGRDGNQPVQLRDGSPHPYDGLTQATNIRTAIASTSPISITDEFGTYTAYLVPEECQIVRVRPQEFVAVVTAREV